MSKIRAGLMSEATPQSGDWVFVDPGFSARSRSCGLLEPGGLPELLTFGDLKSRLVAIGCVKSVPLNLVLEAPLSVSFGPDGPAGRSIERRNGQSRYWYVGLGCAVLVSVTYLLRALFEAPLTRDVRLFEGFVSFKDKAVASNHREDVVNLQKVVWGQEEAGRVVPPEELAIAKGHVLTSAFAVAAMDFGVSPVVVVGR
jgi:hypothetical protein